jgi:hypothetical protein
MVVDEEYGMLASVPSARVVQRLRTQLSVPASAQDIYLAYEGACTLHFAGFLVARVESIDCVLAHCPVHGDLRFASTLWRREVARQINVAIRVASDAHSAKRDADTIWLGDVGTVDREVPRWLYSFACIPITYQWTGKLIYPQPFCPRLFEQMARQPQAPLWLRKRQQLELSRAPSI